jgi:hypothetical protein
MRLFRRASAAIGLGSYAWRNRDRIGRVLSQIGDRLQSSGEAERARSGASHTNQVSPRGRSSTSTD